MTEGDLSKKLPIVMEVMVGLVFLFAIAFIVARIIPDGPKHSPHSVAERGSERVFVPPSSLDILSDEERTAGEEIEIVGESHYQSAIALCRDQERVLLIRQPDNPYDKNAVVVTRTDGTILGYISREEAPRFARLLDSGGKLYAEIHGIYGGTPDKPSRGVWLDVYCQRKRRKPKTKVADTATGE